MKQTTQLEITYEELEQVLEGLGLALHKTANITKNLGRRPALVLATALNERLLAVHPNDAYEQISNARSDAGIG